MNSRRQKKYKRKKIEVSLWFYPINALIYGLGGVLSGVGDTLASIFVKLLVTVWLIGKLGLLSIAIVSCLGWCAASAIVVMRYKGNKRQSKAVVKMIQN